MSNLSDRTADAATLAAQLAAAQVIADDTTAPALNRAQAANLVTTLTAAIALNQRQLNIATAADYIAQAVALEAEAVTQGLTASTLMAAGHVRKAAAARKFLDDIDQRTTDGELAAGIVLLTAAATDAVSYARSAYEAKKRRIAADDLRKRAAALA